MRSITSFTNPIGTSPVFDIQVKKLYVNLFDIKDPTNCVGTFPYTMGVFLEDVEKMKKKREIIFETDSDFPEGLKAALQIEKSEVVEKKKTRGKILQGKKTTSSKWSVNLSFVEFVVRNSHWRKQNRLGTNTSMIFSVLKQGTGNLQFAQKVAGVS